MVGACVAAMPFLKKIPTSVLWGYFAFMAVESLPGNQFWERILLLFTAPNRRYKYAFKLLLIFSHALCIFLLQNLLVKLTSLHLSTGFCEYFLLRVLEEYHATFVETVPFKTIAKFTIFQTAYLLICFGITWVPIAGVLFPLMIMLLVPVRQYLLPKFFRGAHLQDLDAAEYEEAPALSFSLASVSFCSHSKPEFCFLWLYFHIMFGKWNEFTPTGFIWYLSFLGLQCSLQERELSRGTSFADHGEIFDVMITRGRGEIRRTSSLKMTSSTGTPFKDFKSTKSFSGLVNSPRINELRGFQSPRFGGRGPFSPRTGEARRSNLGKGGQNSDIN